MKGERVVATARKNKCGCLKVYAGKGRTFDKLMQWEPCEKHRRKP